MISLGLLRAMTERALDGEGLRAPNRRGAQGRGPSATRQQLAASACASRAKTPSGEVIAALPATVSSTPAPACSQCGRAWRQHTQGDVATCLEALVAFGPTAVAVAARAALTPDQARARVLAWAATAATPHAAEMQMEAALTIARAWHAHLRSETRAMRARAPLLLRQLGRELDALEAIESVAAGDRPPASLRRQGP